MAAPPTPTAQRTTMYCFDVAPVANVAPDTLQHVADIVGPAYVRDVRDLADGRYMWRKAHNVCETAAKALSGCSTMAAFAAGAYSSKTLSFVAGCIGTGALVVMLFSSYAARESKERTRHLNDTLRHVGAAGDMPDLSMPAPTMYAADDDDDDATQAAAAQQAAAATAQRRLRVSFDC